MEIDNSTAHGMLGGKEPPNLAEALDMLRGTLEDAGMVQIKVQPHYVLLAALKALNDAGYTIRNGSNINLSRPVRKYQQTLLSQSHENVIEQLLLTGGLELADMKTARSKPYYASFLVDNAIALMMGNNARRVDGETLMRMQEELAQVTIRTIKIVGTGPVWGLSNSATIADVVAHVLNYYHNAWYRRTWRWFVRLFGPSDSGLNPNYTPKGDK